MPGYDGTGPSGNGPATGRGRGPCREPGRRITERRGSARLGRGRRGSRNLPESG